MSANFRVACSVAVLKRRFYIVVLIFIHMHKNEAIQYYNLAWYSPANKCEFLGQIPSVSLVCLRLGKGTYQMTDLPGQLRLTHLSTKLKRKCVVLRLPLEMHYIILLNLL